LCSDSEDEGGKEWRVEREGERGADEVTREGPVGEGIKRREREGGGAE
jgi:hypothetical protein